jgi:hypothetical protein
VPHSQGREDEIALQTMGLRDNLPFLVQLGREALLCLSNSEVVTASVSPEETLSVAPSLN